MDDTLQLLHLTDPHLLADPEARLHGWQVDAAFHQVLAAACTRYPNFDALVLGGDLVDDESEAGYARLNRTVRNLGRPVLAMAGNHDHPERMARHLEAAHVHTPLTLRGWRLIPLNSHWAGHGAGYIGDTQFAWLAGELGRATKPTLICVHHPPINVRSLWLDAIGLRDGAALTALLAHYPCVRAILCGHAHQAFAALSGAIECLITPSTMRQFSPGARHFAEDHDRVPGYRRLSLGADGHIHSRVHRVSAARRAGG